MKRNCRKVGRLLRLDLTLPFSARWPIVPTIHTRLTLPSMIGKCIEFPSSLFFLSFSRSAGIHHLYQAKGSHYKTNVTSYYIQCGIQDDRSNVILDLIHQIIREKFFYVLRTQVRDVNVHMIQQKKKHRTSFSFFFSKVMFDQKFTKLPH